MGILLLTNLIVFIAVFALFGLLWIIIRLLLRLNNKCIRYRWFGRVSLFLCLLFVITTFYGYFFGRWKYEVTEWTYVDERLPKGFDGYRIVHISDFHLETFNDNPAYVDTIVNAVNSLHPDLICFTGDLVSFTHDGLIPFIPNLSRMKANDGVISILGNHDYAIYERSLDSLSCELDRQQLIQSQRKDLNWNLLLNEHVTLHHNNDSIAIVGVENQACGMRQRVRRAKLTEALSSTEDIFRILLTHDPSHWDAEVVGKTDVPLTLSGHTHAMQCRVFGMTPCRLFFKRSDGAYKEGNQQLYVNIGLGELMPFRIGATPEITLITLKK